MNGLWAYFDFMCDICILLKGHMPKWCCGKIWNSAVTFYHLSRLVYDFDILKVNFNNVCYNENFFKCWPYAIFDF